MLVGTLLGGSLQALAAGDPPGATATATPNATQAAHAEYCKLYENTLAKNLGVSTAKLESANKDALQTVLNQMAADGRITASQKADLQSKLQQFSANPCAFVAQQGGWHGKNSQALATSREAVAAAVAAKLNISATTLNSDLAAGQSIPQIAQAQKVPLTDVNTAYLAAVKAQLNQLVSSGKLTQDQSNQFYQRVQQAMQQGHYPLLEAKQHK